LYLEIASYTYHIYTYHIDLVSALSVLSPVMYNFV